MSTDNSTDVILGSTVVIVGSTMLRLYRESHGTAVNHIPDSGRKNKSIFQPIVFGFFLAAALLALAIPLPGISKGLAYLGLVGAFAVNGPSLFEWFGSFGK